MRVALAQINPTLGDFAGNHQKILDFVAQACAKDAHLIVFPEMSLFGYEPNDLLERDSVFEALDSEFKSLAKTLRKVLPKGVGVLVGTIARARKGKPYHNTAAFFVKGKSPQLFYKELLPSYDVFDEARHIEPGHLKNNIIKFHGKKILVSICEDNWGWPRPKAPRYSQYSHNPMSAIKMRDLDLVIGMNASPYAKSKVPRRKYVATKAAQHFKCPFVYVNMVGGQDEIVFDGGSFVIDHKGHILGEGHRFYEDLTLVDLKHPTKNQLPDLRIADEMHSALVLGIRDYVRKSGFQKVHFGLSGGIDSALVACLAVDAVGANNVTAVAIPGPFSAPESLQYSQKLADNLKISLKEISINNIYDSTVRELKNSFGEWPFSSVHENIQARLRAILLMAFSNQHSSLLLSTSNKSEIATGYSTLYGDMCGSLAPLGDLVKGDVYELCRHIEQIKPMIPAEIVQRAPTAELRPHQRDQDTLPPYPELDEAIVRLVELQKPAVTPVEKRTLEMLYRSEFKRWQAPPILRVTDHAFGRGRRVPLAHRAFF